MMASKIDAVMAGREVTHENGIRYPVTQPLPASKLERLRAYCQDP
jgi:hypothetical protein